MADPRMDDEPPIPEVVRWIADEVTAVLFDGIVAEIIADDLCVAAGKLLQLRQVPQARQAPGLQLAGSLAENAEHGGATSSGSGSRPASRSPSSVSSSPTGADRETGGLDARCSNSASSVDTPASAATSRTLGERPSFTRSPSSAVRNCRSTARMSPQVALLGGEAGIKFHRAACSSAAPPGPTARRDGCGAVLVRRGGNACGLLRWPGGRAGQRRTRHAGHWLVPGGRWHVASGKQRQQPAPVRRGLPGRRAVRGGGCGGHHPVHYRWRHDLAGPGQPAARVIGCALPDRMRRPQFLLCHRAA